MNTKSFSLAVGAAVILLATAALFFYFLAVPSSEQASDTITIRSVYKPNANYVIYFVAREKGYFTEEGLEVNETEMESTNLMVQALVSGQADFNPSNSVPALYAAEQNAPGTFKFLYITLMTKGRSNNAIIVRTDSAHETLDDLRGKIVGTPPGITSVVMAQLIFKGALGSWEDITFKELEPRGLLQALETNQIDAVFAIEPLITMGEERGISRTLQIDAMETYVMDPIAIAGGVVTREFSSAQPDTVERIRRAMEKAIDYIRDNETEARLIMAKAIGMDESIANRLGINTFWKLSEVDPEKVQVFADLLKENGALERAIDTRLMYWETPKP